MMRTLLNFSKNLCAVGHWDVLGTYKRKNFKYNSSCAL